MLSKHTREFKGSAAWGEYIFFRSFMVSLWNDCCWSVPSPSSSSSSSSPSMIAIALSCSYRLSAWYLIVLKLVSSYYGQGDSKWRWRGKEEPTQIPRLLFLLLILKYTQCRHMLHCKSTRLVLFIAPYCTPWDLSTWLFQLSRVY